MKFTCTPSLPRLPRRTVRRRAAILRTSPEFACKKLLAAGEQRIVEFAKVFRNRERGALHHPEFTLVEWYRAGERYEFYGRLRRACARRGARCGNPALTFRGRSADAFAEPERLSVADVFARYAGIDLLATLPDGVPSRELFARAAAAAGIRIADDDNWGDIFSRVLVERIEGHLGIGRATILDQYPAALSALARPAPDPRVAERFEFYVCGAELANGFGELNDAGEQRRRLEREMAEKQRIYGGAIRSTKTSSQRWRRCRPHPASRSASTAWSCWRQELHASIRFYGRRWRIIRVYTAPSRISYRSCGLLLPKFFRRRNRLRDDCQRQNQLERIVKKRQRAEALVPSAALSSLASMASATPPTSAATASARLPAASNKSPPSPWPWTERSMARRPSRKTGTS